jgi:hypothetical protein
LSYSNQEVLAPIRARFLQNKQARRRLGALIQDRDCHASEVFFGNLKLAEFEALPLKTKRKGGPARCVRFISRIEGNETRVEVKTYEQLYQDRESFEVFVHTYELDMLGIEY